MIIGRDKATVTVALMSYIVVGGLNDVRAPVLIQPALAWLWLFVGVSGAIATTTDY